MGKKKKKTTSVAVPLDPAVLSDLDGIRQPLIKADDMNPGRADTYRIWLTYGRREKHNRDVGWLKVQRKSTDEQSVTFSAERVILNGSDRDRPLLFTRHTAEITCANDSLLSLHSFKGDVEFNAVPGEPSAALKGYAISGESGNDGLHLSSGKVLTGSCVSDWLLPAAIRRTYEHGGIEQEFTMLEALTAVKKKQILYPDEPYEGEWFGEKVFLKRILHTGEGIMPFSYWLDEQGSTALITSGYLALIRDEKAEHVFDDLLAEANNG